MLCASELASFAGHSLALSLSRSLLPAHVLWLSLDAALVAEMGSLGAGCGKRSKEEEEEERVEGGGGRRVQATQVHLFIYFDSFPLLCALNENSFPFDVVRLVVSPSLSLSVAHTHRWLGHTHM